MEQWRWRCRLKTSWGRETSHNPRFCAHHCSHLPRIIRTLFINCPFAPQSWYIPVPHGAVEMEKSFEKVLGGGKHRTTPVFVHTVVRPTPNYSHTFHKITHCSAMLIHRGYISSAVDAFVCMTLIHNRYYLLGPWLCTFFVRNPRHHWWSHDSIRW